MINQQEKPIRDSKGRFQKKDRTKQFVIRVTEEEKLNLVRLRERSIQRKKIISDLNPSTKSIDVNWHKSNSISIPEGHPRQNTFSFYCPVLGQVDLVDINFDTLTLHDILDASKILRKDSAYI